MADIPASAVASLRARTGVSIIQCKSALEEAGGDEEKAIELLRSKGEAQAVKKAEREQKEGYIFGASTDSKVALVVVHCETDFVARNEDFQSFGANLANKALEHGAGLAEAVKDEVTAAVQQLGENISLGDVQLIEGETLGSYVHTNGKIGVVIGLTGGGSTEKAKDVAMHAAAMNPLFVRASDVPGELVAKEVEIWTEQLASEGKPAEIMEKIMIGKEKKFREENALLSQSFVKDPDVTIEQFLDGADIDEYLRVAI